MLKATTSRLEDDFARLAALATKPAEHAKELAANLRQIYHAVVDVDLARYDKMDVRAIAPSLLTAIFNARMALRDRIGEWRTKGLINREVERSLRDVFRVARYGGDMLGEIAAGHPRLTEGEKSRRGFTGRDWNTLVHPAYDNGHNIAFQSGDVILMRGTAHNSAAIARIGDIDSQFSHIAIVYIDPRGKHWLVEALIEEGAIINSLESVLDHGLGRAVLYRYKDAGVAARAAELAYERVLATKEGRARHIPYDFSMRMKGRRSLFCAKLVSQAFLDASRGAVRLPAFKTRFDKRNRAFYKSIGVKAKETFAPGDIDLDPDFHLVAEWQDYRVTPMLRRQDMIMTKFFEWMETRGYEFREDFLIKVLAVFGRLSSYLSDRIRTLVTTSIPKVPLNMTRSCVATIVMLHKSAEGVMPSLAALDDDHVKMTGHPLHPREMLAHLERLREVSNGRIGYLVGKP